MKIPSKKYILILVFLFTIFSIFYFYKPPAVPQANILKYPETYSEDDAGVVEYRNALIDWTTNFFETNPKATSSSWSIAKSQFLVDNNCTIAIERSKLSGEVLDLKKWELVDYEVQNTLYKAIDSVN